jgi:ATP-dependent helicase/DNAse subunit B
LKLDIRVDRIDRYDDGTHAIVDYKASKDVSTNMWQGERPEAPQLPLYAMKCELPVSEVAFAQVTTTSVKWESLCGTELKDLRPVWDNTVRRLAEDFLHGRAEVDPRKKPLPCDLCKLAALCRVTEIKVPAKEIQDE